MRAIEFPVSRSYFDTLRKTALLDDRRDLFEGGEISPCYTAQNDEFEVLWFVDIDVTNDNGHPVATCKVYWDHPQVYNRRTGKSGYFKIV